MILIDEAFRILDESLASARPTREIRPVRGCVGRVLLEDQRSVLALPPFDKSAMDGYAVMAGDDGPVYRLLECVAAGQMGTAELRPGTTIKVMTGAPVPARTGRVIMQEHVEVEGDAVRVTQQSRARNVCREGEDIERGDLVLRAGTLIGPLEMANLVSCGIAEVPVASAPRVAVLSTGDEIVDDPDRLRAASIMNVNGPLLAALSRQHGLRVVVETILADDLAATTAGLADALAKADLVMLSGGISAGTFDFVGDAVMSLGALEPTFHFAGVAVKPGRPMAYATAGPKPILCLPGNPVAAYLMFHLFVRRAAAHLSGAGVALKPIMLRLAEPMARRKTHRQEYWPARITRDGTLARVPLHGSAHLAAVVAADGFLVVPRGPAELAEGDRVEFLPTGIG